MTAVPPTAPAATTPAPTATTAGAGFTVGDAGKWGGGAGFLGLMTWAVSVIPGIQEDMKTAQEKAQSRMVAMDIHLVEINASVKSMVTAVEKIQLRSETYVTETRMREYLELQLIKAERDRAK